MKISGMSRRKLRQRVPNVSTTSIIAALAAIPLTTISFEPRPAQAATTCASLTTLSLPNTTITSATPVPTVNGTPAYCDVLATVAPQTDIEVKLPAVWAGRYLHLGGGGFDGSIPSAAPAAFNVDLMADGFVVSASNGGHRGTQYPGASFADNPLLVLGYAHTAISETDRVAYALINALYGTGPKYRYFDGCSNGGKNASIAASLLARHYDGIIGGDGVYGHASENLGGSDMPGLTAVWARAGQVASSSFNSATVGPKMAALYAAEVAKCDALDGLKDGIISNPAACHFNPASIQCPAGTDSSSCLTPTEVRAVRTVMSDLTLNGRVIGAPYGLGNLAGGAGGGAFGGGAQALGQGFLAFAYGNPSYDLSRFDLRRDFGYVAYVLDNFYDMAGPLEGQAPGEAGIADFVRKGGKLILWTGDEDELVPTADSVRFIDRLLSDIKFDRYVKNVRFYSLPGVGHCGGGPGADSIDLLTPMTEWVEHNRAPNTLTASKVNAAGIVAFTRPLCAYPQWPVFQGGGDPNSAASFTCVDVSGSVP